MLRNTPHRFIDTQASAYRDALDGPPSPAHAAFLRSYNLPVPASQREASAAVNRLVIQLAQEASRGN